jgi:hypothetical protein
MEEMRNAYTFWGGIPEEKRSLRRLDVDERIILK